MGSTLLKLTLQTSRSLGVRSQVWGPQVLLATQLPTSMCPHFSGGVCLRACPCLCACTSPWHAYLCAYAVLCTHISLCTCKCMRMHASLGSQKCMHFFRVHTRLSACAHLSGCTCLHVRILLLECSPASRWRRALMSHMQSRDADGRHSSGLSRCLPAACGGGKGSLRARGYQMVLQGQRFSPRWGVAHSGNAAWTAIRTEGGFLHGAGLGAPRSVLL